MCQLSSQNQREKCDKILYILLLINILIGISQTLNFCAQNSRLYLSSFILFVAPTISIMYLNFRAKIGQYSNRFFKFNFWRKNSNIFFLLRNVARFARNVVKWDFCSNFQSFILQFELFSIHIWIRFQHCLSISRRFTSF